MINPSKAILFACLLAGLGGCNAAPQTAEETENSGGESNDRTSEQIQARADSESREREDQNNDEQAEGSPIDGQHQPYPEERHRGCTDDGQCIPGPLPPPECEV